MGIEGVRIEGCDRPGLERLLRYCARPLFARERIERIDDEREQSVALGSARVRLQRKAVRTTCQLNVGFLDPETDHRRYFKAPLWDDLMRQH